MICSKRRRTKKPMEQNNGKTEINFRQEQAKGWETTKEGKGIEEDAASFANSIPLLSILSHCP